METLLLDVIPEIKRDSPLSDELTLLTNKRWVLIDDYSNNKIMYVFRGNEDLLISTNGKVEKAKWKYFGNNSFMIDKGDVKCSFKLDFSDQNILVSTMDNSEEPAVFVIENKYDRQLNTTEQIHFFFRKQIPSA